MLIRIAAALICTAALALTTWDLLHDPSTRHCDLNGCQPIGQGR